jgi:SAM-dependent methyltransferase
MTISSMTPEMEALKARLRTTWMSGDYAQFAKPMEPGALEFLERIAIQPGTEMLDVGCGAGQIAIPAARAGVRVTGLDIAANQVEEARAGADAEGLEVRFDEGDAEMLPYADASFDVVVSLIGAMFAPGPTGSPRSWSASAGQAAASSWRTGRLKASSASCSRPWESTYPRPR